MKNRIIKIVFVVVLSITMHQTCFAGIPIGIGRVLLVPTYTKYSATSYWNNQGQLKAFDNKGLFQSNYLGLYGGFGIGRDMDLVFNIPYVTNKSFENGVELGSLSTIGDVTVGLSYFLNHYDYYKHLSITGSLIFPSYPTDLQTNLLPGFASTGGELKIGLAGTNTTSFKDSYYDMEAGVRSYFSADGPTIFFANATLGVPLGEQQDWKVSGTFNLVSASSNSATNVSANPYLNTNFSYLRATLGLGRKIDRHVEIWATIFKDVIGRSIGQGSGFSIYGVFSF